MQNPKNRSSEPSRKKIRKVVGKMDSNIKEQKTRLLFAYEILNREKEFVFLTEKLSRIQNSIGKTISSLDALNAKLLRPRNELSALLKEKQKADSKMDELKQLEIEYEEKVPLLPELKRNAFVANADRRKLIRTFNALAREKRLVAEELKGLKESGLANANKLLTLEIEIPVLKNTLSLFYGIMPEGYDIDVLDDISVNFKNLIYTYFDETQNEITKVKKQTREFERQLDQEKEMAKSLGPEKISKEAELKGSLDDERLNEPVVFEELERLRSINGKLDEKTKKLTGEINGTNIEIVEQNRAIESQENSVNDLEQRYTYLVKLKQKLDQMDNVEDEIHEINTDIQKIKAVLSVDSALLKTINEIKDDLRVSNGALKNIYRYYNDKLEEIDLSIYQLISH